MHGNSIPNSQVQSVSFAHGRTQADANIQFLMPSSPKLLAESKSKQERRYHTIQEVWESMHVRSLPM
jgi:hypothetical protein